MRLTLLKESMVDDLESAEFQFNCTRIMLTFRMLSMQPQLDRPKIELEGKKAKVCQFF